MTLFRAVQDPQDRSRFGPVPGSARSVRELRQRLRRDLDRLAEQSRRDAAAEASAQSVHSRPAHPLPAHPLAAEHAAEDASWAALSSAELSERERQTCEQIAADTAAIARAQAERLRTVARLQRLTRARFAAEDAEHAEQSSRAGTASSPLSAPVITGGEAEARHRALTEELACALTDTPRTASALLHDADRATTRLPESWTAHAAGRICAKRMRTIAEETTGIRGPRLTLLDRRLAEIAPEVTPPTLARLARALREETEPVSPEDRHQTAFAKRRVYFEACPDGMAQLGVTSAAPGLVEALDRLDRAALELRTEELSAHRDAVRAVSAAHADPAERQALLDELPQPRTLAQLKADLMVTLLTDGEVSPCPEAETETEPVPVPAEPAQPRTPIRPGTRGRVFLTVPVRVLVGLTHDLSPEPVTEDADQETASGKEFAQLQGYGPLDDDSARALTARLNAILPLLTGLDPDGNTTLLDIGRKSRKPPKALRRFLRARDQSCRFPGCPRPAHRCDLDHSIAWRDGGDTSRTNLAHLCRGHHTLKHQRETGPPHRGWQLLSNDSGTLTWKSPAGRTITTRPPPQNG